LDINSASQLSGLPDSYRQAATFFANDPCDYKVLLLPDQYFARYSWGQPRGNPEVLWGKDLVVRQPGDPNETGNAQAIVATKAVLDGASNRDQILSALGVKYIVQRDDYDWSYYSSI